MNSSQENSMASGCGFGEGEPFAGWIWAASPGRWSVGMAMAGVATVSLAVWTAILFAVLP
ncbi:MAG: hypothetical protein KDC18_05375 [Alphaproteobacteria bacterium]|nr:hypothetical protein [Alphaproteobacteria bacterium]MCB9929160.1 hypothetical protein [Alphaproteobacteria bacterium]